MRWRVVLGAALLAWLGLVRGAEAHRAEPLRFAEAALIESDAEEPPPDSAPWRSVRLDAAGPPRIVETRYVWLRMDAEFAAVTPAQQPLAIYLTNFNREIAVFVNGRVAATQYTPAFTRRLVCCGVYVELASDAFSASGVSRVDLRITVASRPAVSLRPLYLGDARELWKRYERRMLVGSFGTLVALSFSVLISAVCLGLWLRRRDERLLLLFGLSAASSAVNSFLERWFGIGDWTTLANLVGAFADYASATLMLVFLLRYAGWRWPRVQAGLWVWVALSVVVEAFADFYDPLSPWHPWWYTGNAVYLATLPLAAAIAWRRRDVWSVLLCTGAAVSAGLIGWQLVLQFTDPEPLYLWPYHQLGLFAVITAMLIDRFAKALGASERLNAELEQRVEAKHAELERNYSRMAEMTRRAAVVEERQRIMSDMHDGIGGQLISTLSLVEHGEATPQQVAAALRECIDDLRLAIDSMVPADDELLPLLGNLRYRIEGQLKQQGIALDWQVEDVPRLACLTPQNVLHVLRILQEAFTNVLKHAQASRIRVATRVAAGQVSIEVSDNGRGMPAETGGRGHGLANMRRRAQALGGSLTVQPSASGTTLSLLLPVG